MNRIFYLVVVLMLVFTSCYRRGDGQSSGLVGKRHKTTIADSEEYQQALNAVKQVEADLSDIKNASLEELNDLSDAINHLRFYFDTLGLDEDDRLAGERLKRRIEAVKQEAAAAVDEQMRGLIIPVTSIDDALLETATAYPVYLERGDILYYKVSLQKQATIKLYNADARALVKTFAPKTAVDDSLVVANKGIYLLEINPDSTQYADIDISYKMPVTQHPLKKIVSEDVECKASDFRAVATKGIRMKSVFEQPRKFTLSSQLKHTFTTSAKSIAVVGVPVPAGTTDILYSLRISTSQTDKSSDGQFYDNMSLSYKKVRFLGKPLYETSAGSGLISSLLDDNRPIREEDAYCNMYVFRSQNAAKLFQDGKKMASDLPYDVDYSTLGTQSCDGRIPMKGARNIYLAFENERVRFTNYIWVEVLSVTPITEYHTTRYYTE